MRDSDCERAAEILVAAFSQVYRQRGHTPPFPNLESAIWLCRAYLDLDREGCAVAEAGSGLVGVGFVHLRGPVASIGPLAARPGGPAGIGRALMAHLTGLANACGSLRLFQDSFNPDSFGLYSELGWTVRDVAPYLMAGDIIAPAAISPAIRLYRPEDRDRLEAFDLRMVGANRSRDMGLLLSTGALLLTDHVPPAADPDGGGGGGSSPGGCWETAGEGGPRGGMKGDLDGFIFLRALPARAIIGPAVATSEAVLIDLLDAACHALGGRSAVMRASAGTPNLLRRSFELGFRVDHLGNLMSLGRSGPPPPQLYALFPESL
jgi:hypothetical protein